MIAAVSFWELVVAALHRSPAGLQIARDNVARWLAQGHSAPHRLAEWDALLADAQSGPAGMERLLAVLTGSDVRSERLRDFHPFAGVLTREERRQAKELCGFRH